jgi:hypothetical protein
VQAQDLDAGLPCTFAIWAFTPFCDEQVVQECRLFVLGVPMNHFKTGGNFFQREQERAGGIHRREIG